MLNFTALWQLIKVATGTPQSRFYGDRKRTAVYTAEHENADYVTQRTYGSYPDHCKIPHLITSTFRSLFWFVHWNFWIWAFMVRSHRKQWTWWKPLDYIQSHCKHKFRHNFTLADANLTIHNVNHLTLLAKANSCASWYTELCNLTEHQMVLLTRHNIVKFSNLSRTSITDCKYKHKCTHRHMLWYLHSTKKGNHDFQNLTKPNVAFFPPLILPMSLSCSFCSSFAAFLHLLLQTFHWF